MDLRSVVTNATMGASAPFWSRLRPHRFSLVLSVVAATTVLFLVDLNTSSMPGPLFVRAFLFTAYVNAAILGWRLLSSFRSSRHGGQRATLGFGLLLALMPLGLWSIGTHLRLYDFSFLLRHESDLREGVSSAPCLYKGLEVCDPIAGLTFVRVGSWGALNSYWLIQSASGKPTLTQFCTAYRSSGVRAQRAFGRIRHLWGSWYRLVD